MQTKIELKDIQSERVQDILMEGQLYIESTMSGIVDISFWLRIIAR